MKIGVNEQSETFLPKSIKHNRYLYFDLAGFNDSRGNSINLLNASFIKNIIENASTTRLVFVVGYDEITASRG